MAQVALLTGLLAGCAEAAEKEDAKASASASATAQKTVESGGTLGTAGSACELPVSFELAESWEPEAVEAPAAQDSAASDGSEDLDEELAQEMLDEMLRQGPVTAACEIDAKPAGYIGFMRIWTGEAGEDDARAVLEAFVADQDGASKAKYSEFKAGDATGAEVEYVYTSEVLDETKQEHAFAVATPDGPVVVHLGGMDTEEHQKMLPAYELAKKTVRVA